LHAKDTKTVEKMASVISHTCQSTDSKTVQGKIVIKNADQTALKSQTETISKCLTDHVQSSSSNVKSQTTVDTVKQLANGSLEVAYTCSGVIDHSAAQSSLHAAIESLTMKETVGKCSQYHGDATNRKIETAATIGKSGAHKAGGIRSGMDEGKMEHILMDDGEGTTLKAEKPILTPERPTLYTASRTNIPVRKSQEHQNNDAASGRPERRSTRSSDEHEKDETKPADREGGSTLRSSGGSHSKPENSSFSGHGSTHRPEEDNVKDGKTDAEDEDGGKSHPQNDEHEVQFDGVSGSADQPKRGVKHPRTDLQGEVEKKLGSGDDKKGPESCADDEHGDGSSSKEGSDKLRKSKPHDDTSSAASDDDDKSTSSEDDRSSPCHQRTSLKHPEPRHGKSDNHIARIFTTSSDVTFNAGAGYDARCARCARYALGHIFSTFVLEGVTLEQVSRNLGSKFLGNFKQILTNEIRKHHNKGLESIKITSLSTYKQNSLIIEFVCIVNPQHNRAISIAIRHALLSKELAQTLKHKYN